MITVAQYLLVFVIDNLVDLACVKAVALFVVNFSI